MSQQIAEFYAKITADTTQIQQSLAKMEASMGKAAKKTQETGGVLGGLKNHIAGLLNPTTLAIGAFTALTGVVASSFGEFQAYAGQVENLTNVTGRTAEEMSTLIQVLDDYKVTVEDISAGTRALKEKGLVPTLDTLADLSDQFLAIEDPAKRLQFAQENLGRSYEKYLKVLSAGGDALRANAGEVNKNLVLTDAQIAKAEEQRLALDALSDAWQGVKVQIGAAVGEVVLAVDKQKDLNAAIRDYAKANGIVIRNQYQAREIGEIVLKQMAEEEHRLAQAEYMRQRYGKAVDENVEALQDNTAAYTDLLGLQESIASQLQSHADAQADVTKRMQENRAEAAALYPWQTEELRKLDEEYVELQNAYTENEAAHHEAMMKMQYDLLLTQLSVGGITAEEKAMLDNFGIMAGIFDEKSVLMADAMTKVAEAVAQGKIKVEDMQRALELLSSGNYTVDVVMNMLIEGGAWQQSTAGGGSTVTYGYAEGGIATGSEQGHWELLHGTEAVIPLKNGSVPVELGTSTPPTSQAQDDNRDLMLMLMAMVRTLPDSMIRAMRVAGMKA